MQVEIGNYDLVYSGAIIQFDDLPITITLPDEIEGDYKFHIYFIKDVLNPNPAATTEFIDMFNLKIFFVNFDNFNNGGIAQLWHLGTLKKKNLYLIYRVTAFPNGGKTLIVNFYTQK